MTKLPALPELELTDDAVIYQGNRRIAYASIQAIVFEVRPLALNRLSQAFYGVDVQLPFGSSRASPKLALHLSEGEVLWIARGLNSYVSHARAEAICAAAGFLSERTFDRRFEKYKREMERNGHFSYAKYQFCRNGELLKSGRLVCNILDPQTSVLLGEFHIHVEQNRTPLERLMSLLGQSGVTIVISENRDCFLSMFRLVYGISWQDEHYRDDAGST